MRSAPRDRNASGCIVEATQSWSGPCTADRNVYLSVQPGDRLLITHPEDNGFYAGKKLETQEIGWFPADIVQVAKPANDGTPERTPEGSHAEESPEKALAADGDWHAYSDPQSGRLWFWNGSTDESFFAEQPPEGWSVHEDDCKRRWWWNQETQECFWEENSKRNSRAAAKQELAGGGE